MAINAPFPDGNFDQFRNNLVKRFYDNLLRADKLFRHTDESEEVASDILRAAVVFLHATLEDFLRSIERVLLPYCDEKTLNEIRLPLGQLAAHREKVVLEVIQESVDGYLNRRTYNNKKDIANLLKKLSIDIEPVGPLLPKLDSLMKRRHQIVHRADRPQGEIEPIAFEQVREWVDLVHKFMAEVLVGLPRGEGREEAEI